MTSTRDKIRSLFLTALMIGSVFGGTVAFAGTAAAAANSSSSFSLSPTDVRSDAIVTHDYELNADQVLTDGASDTLTIDLSGTGATFDSAGPNTVNVVDSNGDEISVDSVSGVGTATLTVSLSPDTSATNEDLVISGQITVNFPSVSSPTAVSASVDYADAGSSDITRTLTLNVQGDNLDRGTGANDYDIAASSGTIGDDGATIFQGEEDISFDTNSPADYERSGGSNEGEPLEFPVPTDQPTGSYETGSPGDTVTVQTPRVTELEVTNQNGDDVAGGSVNVAGSTELTIDTQYNFQNAERLDVTVEDASGLEVTGEVLQSPENEPLRSANGEISFALNEDNLNNEEYTVTVEGAEDLDFGAASESVTFDVTTGEDASIDVQADSVTRGEDVRFEISDAAEGDTHLVAVEADDINGDVASVFRNAGDTVNTGQSNDGQAAAVVEIDDGVGIGSISTGELDTTDVDVTVYDASAANANTDLGTVDVDDQNEIDDDSFEVNEGSVTLDNPQGTYVVGSEINVNGSTAPGIEEVAFYARDEGDFERLLTVDVDGDDTFEEEDVVISSTDDVDSDVLSIPGSYRIAAVDAGDEDVDTNDDGTADATLTSSEISSAVGTQESLRVTDTGLTVDYVSVINGQVADPDSTTGLTINGTAPGQDSVSVSFYGPRGTYDRTTVSVDSNGEFESESVQVGNNAPGSLAFSTNGYTPDTGEVTDTSLSQGNVVMSVFSSGRDGQAGDGDFPDPEASLGADSPFDGADFSRFAERLNARSNTQQQVIDTVASETTEDTGSDDLSEVFQFRFTDGRVSVDSVTGEAGEAFTIETNDTMTVSGVTNRQPDDNTITVEVIEGPSSSQFDIESTENWGTSGQWSVAIPTEGVEPGNYTVEASVGGNSDIRSFQVTEDQLQEPTTPTEPNETETEPEPEPTDTETEMDMDTDTEMDMDTETEPPATDEPTATTTEEEGPGFTAVLALVALVAAALLAVRRRD
jgi:PGF-CTERM protein/surface glycoprotein (TIGR04207 family)